VCVWGGTWNGLIKLILWGSLLHLLVYLRSVKLLKLLTPKVFMAFLSPGHSTINYGSPTHCHVNLAKNLELPRGIKRKIRQCAGWDDCITQTSDELYTRHKLLLHFCDSTEGNSSWKAASRSTGQNIKRHFTEPTFRYHVENITLMAVTSTFVGLNLVLDWNEI